jgi:hypothetical protein
VSRVVRLAIDARDCVWAWEHAPAFGYEVRGSGDVPIYEILTKPE